MSAQRHKRSDTSLVIVAAVEAGASSIGEVSRMTGYSIDYSASQLSILSHEGRIRRVGHGTYGPLPPKPKTAVRSQMSETGIAPIPLHRLMAGRA